MLQGIFTHVGRGESFAFESTLSGRGYTQLIPTWHVQGYRTKMFFAASIR